MTTTTSFTAVGAGTKILAPSETTIVYALSGTFTATLQLVTSSDGGTTWAVALEKTAAASGEYIVTSKSGRDSLVMWRCTAYSSGTAVTTIAGERNNDAGAAGFMNEFINVGGYEVLSFDATHTTMPAEWISSGVNCRATYTANGDVETLITGDIVRTYTYDGQYRLTKIDVV